MVDGEEEPVVADALPEDSFPFVALKGFYVSLERVARHLRDHARDTLLDRVRQNGEIGLSVFRKSQTQLMLDFGPGFCFALADLF